MQKIGSYFIAAPEDQNNGEEFKIITFALTMWVTVFLVLFFLAPLVYGATATKPKLYHAFVMTSISLMLGSGLAGLRSKSKSLSEMLLRAFAGGFVFGWITSLLVLIID
jgi:hypothetical protein